MEEDELEIKEEIGIDVGSDASSEYVPSDNGDEDDHYLSSDFELQEPKPEPKPALRTKRTHKPARVPVPVVPSKRARSGAVQKKRKQKKEPVREYLTSENEDDNDEESATSEEEYEPKPVSKSKRKKPKLSPKLSPVVLLERCRFDPQKDKPAVTVKPKNNPVPASKWKKPRRHREFVNGQPIDQRCDLCHEYPLIPDMPSHMESHVKDYAVKCPNQACSSIFSCPRKMEYHTRRLTTGANPCREAIGLQVRESLPKKCEAEGCTFETPHGNAFIHHLQEHEYTMSEKIHPCPIPGCPVQFALRQSVDEHIYHHDLRPPKKEQKCPVCESVFKVVEIAQHFKDAHQAEEVISCKRCPFLSPSKEKLLDHLYEHRGLGLTCDLCDDDIKFSHYHSLRQHFFNKHQVGKKYVCEHCERSFFAESPLAAHIKTKHCPTGEAEKKPKKETKRFQCDLCPESFSTCERRLTLHKYTAHGLGENPLICRICQLVQPNLSILRLHEKSHAGLVKSYKCDVPGCGKDFKFLTFLRNHKLSHEDSRSFVCDLCAAAFNHATNLHSHMITVHLGKKCRPRPCMCDTCGESFASREVLKKHKRIHTGEMPYNCPICDQAFRYREAMNRHIKGHQQKGADFKPAGTRKTIRKRVDRNMPMLMEVPMPKQEESEQAE